MATAVEVPFRSTFVLPFSINKSVTADRSQSELVVSQSETVLTEDEFKAILLTWEADISKAARAAAFRFQLDREYAEDFAQEARFRLFTALRRQPLLPKEYLRRVISNAIQTAVWKTRMLASEVSLDEAMEHLEAKREEPGTHQDLLVVAAVRNFISGLPLKLQRVYQLIYEQAHTQREAAIDLCVAQPRIAQMHRELLERARRCLGHLNDKTVFLAA